MNASPAFKKMGYGTWLFPEASDQGWERRLAIRFRYGDGPVYEVETEAHTDTGAGAAEDATPDAPAPAPIVDVPAGAEFLIQPSSAKDYCLAVRADGYTKDSHEVFLAKVAPDTTAQRWRLVGRDTFQHVASGRFLH